MPKKYSTISAFYRGKKVVVAGGSGFIGSFIVKRLVACDAEVYIVCRSLRKIWRLKEVERRIKIFRFDLSHRKGVDGFFSKIKPEIIINASAAVDHDQTLDGLGDQLRDNFQVALNLVSAAAEHKAGKFIHIGSIAEYGDLKSPLKETAREKPISPYSLSKIMATQAVLLYGRLSGLMTTVVRPAAVFGPSQDFGTMLIPNLIRSCLDKKDFAMNPGGQIRDFVYIDDLVNGVLAAGASPRANGEIFNLGSNKGYKIKHLANLVNKLMGHPIDINFGAYPYRPLDTMRYYMDSTKAAKILGWKAKTGMRAALQKTVRWYNLNEN
jgi:nucleoside-diphosphate-sugar epimerase